MTTVDDAIDQVLDHLDFVQRPTVNTLKDPLTISGTTLVTTMEAKGIANGALLGVGNEVMLVLETSGTTITVVRGHRSIATAHAAGALVEVRPRFPRGFIIRHLKAEIASWHSDLFWVDEPVVGTTSSGTRGYDIDIIDGTRILNVELGPGVGDVSSSSYQLTTFDYRLHRMSGTTSGWQLILPDVGETRTYRVTLARPFVLDTFDAAVDLEADVHLPFSLVDAACLGAASRMLQEGGRTAAVASDATQEQTVPPGHISQVRQDLRRQADMRLEQERQRLMRLWPYR